MPTAANEELVLHTGEGVNLEPSPDWTRFTKRVLGFETTDRYLALGIYTGQLVVRETGSKDPDIVNVIAERFADAIRPSLVHNHKDEEYDTFLRGAKLGFEIENTLGDRA